jgi:PAT family beta-lactamase induction signal transducer AmpG
MSHYAFATGVMAGTKWFTGTISGWLYGDVAHGDYQQFFLWVLIFSIAPIALAWIAPFPHREEGRPAPAPA